MTDINVYKSKSLGGEFGWGGTSAIIKRRCPKVVSEGTETTRRVEGQKLA